MIQYSSRLVTTAINFKDGASQLKVGLIDPTISQAQ